MKFHNFGNLRELTQRFLPSLKLTAKALKIGRNPKGNDRLNQPSLFRCESVSFREGNFLFTASKYSFKQSWRTRNHKDLLTLRMQQKEITMYWMICFNKPEFVHTRNRNLQNYITKLGFFVPKKRREFLSNASARTSVLENWDGGFVVFFVEALLHYLKLTLCPRTMVVERLLSIWEGLCLKATLVLGGVKQRKQQRS